MIKLKLLLRCYRFLHHLAQSTLSERASRGTGALTGLVLLVPKGELRKEIRDPCVEPGSFVGVVASSHTVAGVCLHFSSNQGTDFEMSERTRRVVGGYI